MYFRSVAASKRPRCVAATAVFVAGAGGVSTLSYRLVVTLMIFKMNNISHITQAPVLLRVGPEAAVALCAGVAHLPQVALVALEARAAHAEAGAGVGAPLGPGAG